MPRGDGTGPFGQGPGTGKGRSNKGQEQKRAEWGGAGPGGQCLCSSCNVTMAHQPGLPCSKITCPSCGKPMTRK